MPPSGARRRLRNRFAVLLEALPEDRECGSIGRAVEEASRRRGDEVPGRDERVFRQRNRTHSRGRRREIGREGRGGH